MHDLVSMSQIISTRHNVDVLCVVESRSEKCIGTSENTIAPDTPAHTMKSDLRATLSVSLWNHTGI